MPPVPPSRRSIGFLLVLALAYAGGVTAYLPLLSLLLPMQVSAVAGEQQRREDHRDRHGREFSPGHRRIGRPRAARR